jgi:hypothetical protein
MGASAFYIIEKYLKKSANQVRMDFQFHVKCDDGLGGNQEIVGVDPLKQSTLTQVRVRFSKAWSLILIGHLGIRAYSRAAATLRGHPGIRDFRTTAYHIALNQIAEAYKAIGI